MRKAYQRLSRLFFQPSSFFERSARIRSGGPAPARRRSQGGAAVVETALLMPWLIFLFIGVFDLGFYMYAAICTQSAARAAAIATSQSQSTQTFAIECAAALGELNTLPNMGGVSTCATSSGGITNALPIAVLNPPTTLSCTTTPKCADCTAYTCTDPVPPTSVQTAVTYQTLPMIPIPGVLTGRVQLTRVAEMRIAQ